MNYDEAREIVGTDGKPTGLFHYTSRNDDHIRPIGYCSQWQECPSCEGVSFMSTRQCLTCSQRGVVKVDNPCPGHLTKEQAVEHYRQYVLDKRVRYDGLDSSQQRKCQICGTWTQRFVVIDGYESIVFCDIHRNKDIVSTLYAAPYFGMHS